MTNSTASQQNSGQQSAKSMSMTQTFAMELMRRASVTPEDAGCQEYIEQCLRDSGFQALDFSQGDVVNTLYTLDGQQPGPHLLLLGHTDVVPPGDLDDWHSDPFQPAIRDGYLYGRGAADMKGAVAAMMSAGVAFAMHYPTFKGRLSILLTSDEEGPAMDGVRAVVPQLQAQQLMPDYCLVGEPSCLQTLGDNMRIGRRGSIHAQLTIQGVQGHTAYAAAEDNPVHQALAAIHAIAHERFDTGDAAFPPSILHISNIQAGTGANNVTPGRLQVRFNIRNNPASPAAKIKQRIEQLLRDNGVLVYELEWKVSGEPFVTRDSQWIDTVSEAVARVTGRRPVQDTGGGTSDGRFFAAAGCPVVEFGLVNQTIHQINENTQLIDLDRLHTIFYQVFVILSG